MLIILVVYRCACIEHEKTYKTTNISTQSHMHIHSHYDLNVVELKIVTQSLIIA